MSVSLPQNRWWLWLPLLGIAAWLAFFGDKTPTGSVSIEVAAPSAVTQASTSAVRRLEPTADKQINLEMLQPRDQLFPPSNRKTVANDLFAANSWTPPPKPVAAVPILPPPPPTAPPIPFTYIGKKLEASKWEVYVARGEQSFVLREGSTVDNNYLVHQVSPPNLTLIYLPLGQTQTLSIGESQ